MKIIGHYSLLITRYSVLITHCSEYKHPHLSHYLSCENRTGLSIYVSHTNVPFFDPSLQLGQRSKNGTFVRET